MRTLISAAVASVLVAATPIPPASADTVIEAESGSVDNPSCGDGQDPPMGPTQAGEAVVMFFPASTCSETFHPTGAAELSSVRYFTSGVSGTICGRFFVVGTEGGTASGATPVTCTPNDTWVDASFSGPAGFDGPFRLVWQAEPPTPADMNASVDYLTLVDDEDTGAAPGGLAAVGTGEASPGLTTSPAYQNITMRFDRYAGARTDGSTLEGAGCVYTATSAVPETIQSGAGAGSVGGCASGDLTGTLSYVRIGQVVLLTGHLSNVGGQRRDHVSGHCLWVYTTYGPGTTWVFVCGALGG